MSILRFYESQNPSAYIHFDSAGLNFWVADKDVHVIGDGACHQIFFPNSDKTTAKALYKALEEYLK